METKADNEDSNLNNEGSDVDKMEDGDSTLKHRKIMDCAKETFESGKTNSCISLSQYYCVYCVR